jgi:glycosyltransferase 2 family protein
MRRVRGIARAAQDFARPFHGRIGWHRVGVAIGVVIVAFAAVTLFRLLREADLAKVIAALRATSPRTVLTAAGLIALSYVTLTFYDFFALRTIGRRDVPYRMAALASFSSYTIGHNLGATVFTGGAVRYRLYSTYGLTLIDIARIAFVTGLTFWLGNAFVLGVGIAWAPEAASAVNQMPVWLNRAIALSAIMAIAGYVLWLLPHPRLVGRSDWQITLPNAPLTLVQIGLGVLDLGFSGLAMYMLLPVDPAIELIPALVTFVMAALLGFFSHAPGSLGVFDAAMLVGLPQFEIEQLLASLLIFRVLYFLLPLAFAACALGVREVWLLMKASRSP